MAVSLNLGEYHLVRSLTPLCIIALIIVSVYQLNLTLEFLKRLIDYIEETEQTYERHSKKNMTLAKLMFEPMTKSARDMYDKHEPAIIMNIIIYTSLIALSMAGLVVAMRKHIIMLIAYGISLDLIYLSSFIYCARVRSLHCAFIVFVSIISFIRAHHLCLKKSENKIRLIQANSTADHENMIITKNGTV